ncbi:MAG: isopentenyl phosphate kinase [Candidatus Colwellbacteria bacterium]
MKTVSLVKLGGSVITDKARPYTPNLPNIKKLARIVAEIHNSGHALILGTGAGSFGHYPVVKYKIGKGVKNKNQLLGFALTQSKVTILNGLVIEALIKNGVPAIPIHPSSVAIASKGKIKSFQLDTIIHALRLGAVPVVHGDMVIDLEQGGAVISTENLFEDLAKRLPKRDVVIKRAIYISNSSGVLDKQGRVIKNLSHKDKDVFSSVGLTRGYDVTGGMRSKLKSSFALAKRGIPVHIVGANSRVDILKATQGQPAGTKIS